MKFKLSDIENAFQFVAFDGVLDKQAIIDRQTGEIHLWSSDYDDGWSEDQFDPERHVSVPDKYEFDLGTHLVHRFVREMAPGLTDEVHGIFSRKGAYGRFKDLLDRKQLLQAWFDYEEQATKSALREWCRENEIELEQGEER